MGWVVGRCCCEEVGCCWGVELGGEDSVPPMADGRRVGEELRWTLGECFVLQMRRQCIPAHILGRGSRTLERTYFEYVWVCWMERSGDDGREGGDIVKVCMADGE